MSQSPGIEAILLAVRTPDDDWDETRSLSELEQLLLGLGIPVTHRLIQHRASRGAPTYVGEGKLREAAALTGGPGEPRRGPVAALESARSARSGQVIVAVDDELSPTQQRNLEQALDVEVLDRAAVILRVFEARAQTREAKLEVELARLTYEMPRIRDDHSLGDREGGGGRASRGHTNVELAKQRARVRLGDIEEELEKLQATADRRRAARAGTFRVALVGYTNSGKSTLMRQLTGSEVLVEDKLFATLGTTVRQLTPPTRPPVLLADTVGFVNRLPHALVRSFRSTLAEAREAMLLLHVADAADPAVRAQIQVTSETLRQIGAGQTPQLLLLNKADRLEASARAALAKELPSAQVMSAYDPGDCAALRSQLEAFFQERLEERAFSIPYARQGALAELRAELQVVREEYGDDLSVVVRGTPEVLKRLAARLNRGG